MDNRRATLYAVRACGLAAAAVFVLVKAPPNRWTAALAPSRLDHGDLYFDAQVRDFKLPEPDEVGPPLDRGASADAGRYRLYTMGDSFFYFRRGRANFPSRLSERLGLPFYHETWNEPGPACVFERLGAPVDKSVKRVFVLESVERLIERRLAAPAACPALAPEQRRSTRSAAALAARAFALVFSNPEDGFRFFVSHSLFAAPLAEALATARFRLFGIMPAATPVYSRNPPFLFMSTETDPDPSVDSSFYHPHPPELVERIADSIARVRDELRARANAELVFVPVPSKYTLYHGLVNADAYDDYLPRLEDALERRGVRVVRLYEAFKRQDRPAYFPTDTHWNPLGMDIALDATAPVAARALAR